ncbi:MAG: M1 family metallopeptidase, partial [Chitinophagaceae bacterium]
MKKSGLLLIFILPLVVKSQSDYWQQRVNYFIEVTLNDTEHSLEAFEKLEYINHSPDTLNFIWFHVWLNAYKNDRTAFSEQRLSHNRTDFYFSEKEDRGYINRLDFKVNGITTRVENHPVHIDIIKVLLPAPLQPGHTITITTPFHVKLPKVFSRGGHVSQSYQLTQWYPKPAVYDRKGWHALPYLDQGEFYSEFGDYDVRITLPGNYVVAATGKLQDEHEIQWLKEATNANRLSQQQPAITTEPAIKKVTKPNDFPASSPRTKTLHYLQKDVHDFAWFADKRFLINHDTLTLASGKVVQIQSFYLPSSTGNWKSSTRFMKDVIRTRSEWIGEYPYQTMSAVETETGLRGGMEYPAITNISKPRSEDELSRAISHEVTHNWFYGILASNERLHPWMDEGMTTYYDSRYREAKKFTSTVFMQNFAPLFLSKRIPDNIQGLAFETIAGIKKDQPINTSSEKFNGLNYSLITYHQGGDWMKKLETFLGRPMFDSCM